MGCGIDTILVLKIALGVEIYPRVVLKLHLLPRWHGVCPFTLRVGVVFGGVLFSTLITK